LAEALDSSGGLAGDGINVTLTSTTPDNKYMWMYGNNVGFAMRSRDRTNHLMRGKSRTHKLGKYYKTIKLTDMFVPTKDITEMNDITDQIEEWMLNGSGQTGENQIYLAIRTKVSGNWRWKTWKNAGTKQNWLKGELKNVNGKISNQKLILSFDFEESD